MEQFSGRVSLICIRDEHIRVYTLLQVCVCVLLPSLCYNLLLQLELNHRGNGFIKNVQIDCSETHIKQKPLVLAKKSTFLKVQVYQVWVCMLKKLDRWKAMKICEHWQWKFMSWEKSYITDKTPCRHCILNDDLQNSKGLSKFKRIGRGRHARRNTAGK